MCTYSISPRRTETGELLGLLMGINLMPSSVMNSDQRNKAESEELGPSSSGLHECTQAIQAHRYVHTGVPTYM